MSVDNDTGWKLERLQKYKFLTVLPFVFALKIRVVLVFCLDL